MSKTSDYTNRRQQLRDGDYTVPEGSLCDYGCGLSARFILMGKDKVERFCCSRRYLSCQAMRYVGSKPRALHLEGKTFNHLTALHPLGKSKAGTVRWLCRCSCAKETVVTSSDLVRGRIKSCGCLWKNDKVDTLEYRIYHSAKGRAKKRGLPFTIELSDVHIPERCPVLDIPLKSSAFRQIDGYHSIENIDIGRLADNSPSLERLYPSDGYVRGNVVVISHKANRLKQDNTPEQLIELGEKFRRLYETLR